MRILVKVVGYAACIVVIVMVAQYAFTMSDNVLIGAVSAFLYGLITFGGLAGPAITARAFRYRWIVGLFFAAATAACFVTAVSNEIEAMTERGDGQQAGRMLIADTVQDARRSLEQAEKDRRGLVFTPANEAAVQAATAKASAATSAKNAECAVRGSKCREREAAETQALADLAAVTRDKALTDQAATLDAQIAALRAEIKKAGPVLQTNSSGKAFARLLGLPDTDAAKIATWKLGVMMIVAEFFIMGLLLVSETLDKHERAPARAAVIAKPAARCEEQEEAAPTTVIEHEEIAPPEAPYAALEPVRKPQPLPAPARVIEPQAQDDAPRVHAAARRAAEAAEGTPAPRPFPAPAKPRLIASEAVPVGNVVEIMAALMEPGRGKVELLDVYAAYSEVCKASGKRPVEAPNSQALSQHCAMNSALTFRTQAKACS